MFEKLQQKWKVSRWQLFVILCTFAIGGSLTGMTGRKILQLFPVEQPVIWTLLYIMVMTLIWPVMVLTVSIPFGQFRFFRNYLSRIIKKMNRHSSSSVSPGTNSDGVTLAIFASGTGSNAQRIIEHFRQHPGVNVGLIVSNKETAGVLEKARLAGIPALVIEKEKFFRGDAFVPELKEAGIDFIVLAGFLWKVPPALVAAYPNRMVNIHPALLPKYGGKGMYGKFVHEAVLAAGDKESGITIHLVDEQYDHGAHLFQAKCPVFPDDTPDTLAARIHELEHAHFPSVIEQAIQSQLVKKQKG